jgi:hypothetical protein
VPVAVAVGRNNTIDSLLVFTLLLAAWAALSGDRTWLVEVVAHLYGSERASGTWRSRALPCWRCHWRGPSQWTSRPRTCAGLSIQRKTTPPPRSRLNRSLSQFLGQTSQGTGADSTFNNGPAGALRLLDHQLGG